MTKTADAFGGFLLYNAGMSEKIKRAKITELQPDPNNLNKHTQRGHTIVENSMRKRGLGRGILAAGKGVDNPVVMAGNLTLEKAVDAGFENVILVHTTGNELVVTVRDDLAPDSAEAIALAIEDNESSKQSYNPDIDVLAALAQGENAVLAALREEDKILNSVIEGMGLPDENAGADTEPEISRADELREKWQTETGQLWQLGRHRLLCGDSTKREDVERVMGGERASACITDPPWNVGWEYIEYQDEKSPQDYKLFSDSWREQAETFGCSVFFVAMSMKNYRYFFFWFPMAERIFLECQNFVQYQKIMMQYACNPILVWGDSGVKGEAGKRDYFIAETSNTKATQDKALARINSAARFLPTVEYLVDFTDGIIYDPFGGSGTTLIACENLNRDCRMIEISPAYCAVILERWAAHTGGTPELVK